MHSKVMDAESSFNPNAQVAVRISDHLSPQISSRLPKFLSGGAGVAVLGQVRLDTIITTATIRRAVCPSTWCRPKVVVVRH